MAQQRCSQWGAAPVLWRDGDELLQSLFRGPRVLGVLVQRNPEQSPTFPLERPKSMSTDGLMKSVDSKVGVKWEVERNYKKMRTLKNKG